MNPIPNASGFSEIEKNFVEYILYITGPSVNQDKERNEKLDLVKKQILKALEEESKTKDILIFPIGSYCFKSYHSNSDIDLTIVMEDKETKKIISYDVNYLDNILGKIKNSISAYCQENNMEDHTEIIEGEVKLVKLVLGKYSFDISFHNFSGLFKLMFMHHLEEKYLDPYFYKRTFLLIKAYCYYQASILGSNAAALGSYALEVLVIYMFNLYSDQFTTELEAFFTFFKIMNKINWDNQCVTIYGLFEKSDAFSNLNEAIEKAPPNPNMKFTYQQISEFLDQYKGFFNMNDNAQTFNPVLLPGKSMYIINPISVNTSNLAKSVNPNISSRIKAIFSYMTDEIESINNMKTSNSFGHATEYFNVLLGIFHDRVISCNADLFRLNLPEPKIVIVTSRQNLEEKKNLTEDESDLNLLLQEIDKKFSMDEKEAEKGPKVDNGNLGSKNKVNGLLWPSNEENLDEQTLIDYKKKNISNITYITKEFCAFITNLEEGGNRRIYDFKTELTEQDWNVLGELFKSNQEVVLQPNPTEEVPQDK
ncbi:MAG: nucleotidyltransferase domain-containing protein [archaeon]|nr:nucleotidyltransferase domain-containing protein [archaeon]